MSWLTPHMLRGPGLPEVGGQGAGRPRATPYRHTEHSGLSVFLEGNFLSFQSGWAGPTAAASLKTVARQRDKSLPDLPLGEMVGWEREGSREKCLE